MALGKSRLFQPVLTVYDCMDELAQFKFAPPELRQREQELFEKADLVFTGGQTYLRGQARAARRRPRLSAAALTRRTSARPATR
ncbi:MAG: hypothetical protein WKG07_07440 [Hymenobacter sp.]